MSFCTRALGFFSHLMIPHKSAPVLRPDPLPGTRCGFVSFLGGAKHKIKQQQYGVSQKLGYLIGGPHNKHYSILGSFAGCPDLGEQPIRTKSEARVHSTRSPTFKTLKLPLQHPLKPTLRGWQAKLSPMAPQLTESCTYLDLTFKMLKVAMR